MTDPTARTRGAHHLGLTVVDLASARTFFLEALGFTVVGELPDYPAVFLSDGTLMLTLWQAQEPADAVAFDRHRNIGLHHFALALADPQSLDAIAAELAHREDTVIEFAPRALGTGGVRHMMCLVPGGIRMELIAA